VLLLASRGLNDVIYFPSYELLLDDLRDYRYYDRDLVHPSTEAVDYILDFFNGQFLSAEEEQIRKRIVQVRKEIEHRPFLAESTQHQSFLKKLVTKMEAISKDYGTDFIFEIEEIKAKIL